MAAVIDTTKVEGRRQLHFTSLEEISADVEQLAKCKEIRCLGNWSAGQTVKHIAIVMDAAIDGAPPVMSRFTRFMIRLLMKRRFLTKPMPAGFQLPAKAGWLIPPPTSLEEGLQSFRKAVQRLKTETKRMPHVALGKLTVEEWNQVHCRHAELHLSFLVPA